MLWRRVWKPLVVLRRACLQHLYPQGCVRMCVCGGGWLFFFLRVSQYISLVTILLSGISEEILKHGYIHKVVNHGYF